MGEFVMHRLFPIVCNMSLTASVVILAVLAVRRLLRRAPKVFSYALWAVVLFRLLCPVSVTSAVSLLGALGAPAQERTAVTSVVEVRPGGHRPRYGPHDDAFAPGAVPGGTRREHRQHRPQRDSACRCPSLTP